ncbi:hypothetical protein GF338_11440 [candidate division WOR-3 bacterium]|nr:hypothetical protein [candidate division WOR-3 bacterium]
MGTEVLSLMVIHAFEELKVKRALVNPAKTNRSIIRVNEKCGFTTIGGYKGSLLTIPRFR